jgi:hypothetical protein
MGYALFLTLRSDGTRGGIELDVWSPFAFRYEAECQAFGQAMYEPPRTVVSWMVTDVEDPGKYRFIDGVLKIGLREEDELARKVMSALLDRPGPPPSLSPGSAQVKRKKRAANAGPRVPKIGVSIFPQSRGIVTKSFIPLLRSLSRAIGTGTWTRDRS